MITELLPWLFGILGMVCLFMSYQQTKREMLLLCKMGADAMWVLHYLFLGAYGGAVPNFVGIFRELVFWRGEKAGDKAGFWRSPILPALFILIGWTLAISTWQSPMSIVPMGASTFVTISLWMKKPKLTRLICIPVSICFIVYDIFVGSYIGIINESIALCSIVSSVIRNDLPKKSQK